MLQLINLLRNHLENSNVAERVDINFGTKDVFYRTQTSNQKFMVWRNSRKIRSRHTIGLWYGGRHTSPYQMSAPTMCQINQNMEKIVSSPKIVKKDVKHFIEPYFWHYKEFPRFLNHGLLFRQMVVIFVAGGALTILLAKYDTNMNS